MLGVSEQTCFADVRLTLCFKLMKWIDEWYSHRYIYIDWKIACKHRSGTCNPVVRAVMIKTHTIYSRYIGSSVSHDLAYLKSTTSMLLGFWCKAMSSDYAIVVTYGICCQKAINGWKLNLSYMQVSGWGCYGNEVCIYEALHLTDLRSRASILYGFGAK